MTPPTPPIVTLRSIVTTLQHNAAWWLTPGALFALAALGYALLRAESWQASQALLVRDEAGGMARQGRFDTAEAMKAALETIHEIARSRPVVEAALKSIGPPPGRMAANWPAAADVEAARAEIALAAPKGAEFGRTEMIYLTSRGPNRERALALCAAVVQELTDRLRSLRNDKAQSIILELEKTASLTQADLDQATLALETMEMEVGSDLGELRTLNEQGAGDSNLRSALNQIKEELRAAQTAHEGNQQQLAHLSAARQNPDQLLGMPGRLLESQPALRRLKDGLVDAQLRSADILAKMNERHPLAQAALAAEDQVRQDLRGELETAVAGVEADMEVSAARVLSLEQQLAEVHARLDRLAGLRARYSNLVADVQHRGGIVEKARKDLADARASLVSAQSASLINRLGNPDVGSSPIGPGKGLTVLGGLAAGLLTGFGLVFLKTSPTALRGRRFSDCLAMGRRASDLLRGRRASDPEPGATPGLRVERRGTGDERRVG